LGSSLQNLLKNSHLRRFQDTSQKNNEDLQAVITHHPNGLIVLQLNQPLQSLFLNADEATAIAKALLLEARRVRIRRTTNGSDTQHI
jgi:hypothetical protein